MTTFQPTMYNPNKLYQIISELNYKKHPEKKFVFTRAKQLIDDNFHKCLKIMEAYYHKNNKQYEQKNKL